MKIEPSLPPTLPIPPVQAPTPVVSLQQRLQQMQAGAGTGRDDDSAAGDTPEPEVDPVRSWALQIFQEKIFYGEEEENGIPSLSIEI